MADDLEFARATFEEASGLLGWDVFGACTQGSEELLGATEISQPAILTVSVAMARERAIARPDAVAGHSVGEFAALVVAGAMSFEHALHTVARRAEAMARAGKERRGGMVAVLGLSEEQARDVCRAAGGSIALASINAPKQVVLSGEHEALARAAGLARAEGARRVIPLDVSVAAHSPSMERAAGELRGALRDVRLAPPAIPFVSSVTGEREDDPDRIAELLCRALTSPVRWVAAVERLRAMGVDSFEEMGPGAVLTGLIRRILPAEARP
jgi:[acyl-carrier-protein] S-malonyltransferase